MFRFHSAPFLRFALFAISLTAVQMFDPRAEATTPAPPTNPTDQCNVILKYEGLCNNLRPNHCLNQPGIDYFGNLGQQKIWDNYYWLCVNIPGNYDDRNSHECIQKLGIGATCISTVQPLVEYVPVTTISATAQGYKPTPKYEMVTEIHATYCMMLASTGTTIRNYHIACGDVPASQCSNAGAPIAEFQTACGAKKPCECVKSFGCKTDYCPATSSPTPPSEPAPPPVPGDAAPGSDSTPDGGGAIPAPAPGLGAGGDGFLHGATEKSGDAAAGGKTTGCSLHPLTEARSGLPVLPWFLGVLIPILGFRGLYFFKSLSQR